MEVLLLDEAGYLPAMVGLSLSYNVSPHKAWNAATRLAHMDGGHNKFLESMVVWLDIVAPRYWWQQFDTYRVGMTKQSQSTMHTMLKKHLTPDDFEAPGIPSQVLEMLNMMVGEKQFDLLKALLPESFLQRRIVCTNYKVIRNIVAQRKTHRLKEWEQFINAMRILRHSQFIFEEPKEETE